MPKDEKKDDEIVMTVEQEKEHDREYREYLIQKGLLVPAEEP